MKTTNRLIALLLISVLCCGFNFYPQLTALTGVSDPVATYPLTLGAGEIGGINITASRNVESLGPNLTTDPGFDAVTEGSELATNGDFTNWTGDVPDGFDVAGTVDVNSYIEESVGGGECHIFSDNADFIGIRKTGLTVGNAYIFSVDLTDVSAGGLQIGGASGDDIVGDVVASVSDFYFNATATHITIARDATVNGGVCDITIDNFSIKPITFSSWTAGTGWAPQADAVTGALTGKAVKVAGTASWLIQDAGTDEGATYIVGLTTVVTAGYFATYVRASAGGTSVTSSGTYRIPKTGGTVDGNDGIYAPDTFAGTIDNITIRAVTNPAQNKISVELDNSSSPAYLWTWKTVAGTAASVNQTERDILVDFTGGNETDGPGKVTVAKNTITLTDGDRDEDYYVTFDQGAGNITDFTHWVDVNVTALTNDNSSGFSPWCISNADDDLKDIDDASGDFISLWIQRSDATHYKILIMECSGGTLTVHDTSSDIAVGTETFVAPARSGTTLTGELYSTDALRAVGGAGDVDTITYGSIQNTAFRYVYGLGSYSDGTTGKDISGTIKNLNLRPERDIITLHDADNKLWVFHEDTDGGYTTIVAGTEVSDASVKNNKRNYAVGDGSGTFSVERLRYGAEEATGTCVLNQLYQITVSSGGDTFFAGDSADDYFISDGTEVMSAVDKAGKVNP